MEGSYIRAGLVTDIELIDGYPANYISYAMRSHRWVRGDWQLVPWLFGKVRNAKGERVKNPLSAISKWKIFDNLRRSLLPPSLFLLLTLGLTVLPRADWFWLGLFTITLTMPLLMDVVLPSWEGWFFPIDSWGISCTEPKFGHADHSDLCIFSPSGIPHDRCHNKVHSQVFFTRKTCWSGLPPQTPIEGSRGPWRIIGKNVPSHADLSRLFIWVVTFRQSLLFIPLVISLFGLSPLIAYRISQPKYRRESDLSKEQVYKLRMIARKTWKYFDEFVGPEDNWLTPDNYQEEPHVG